jgi:hypothetical protein
MKKIGLFLICVSMVLLISACSAERGTEKSELPDYRPMIYVKDNLYGETADTVSTLPNKAVYIGAVEKVVPQNEPMVQENFTSNLLPVGSEIYYNESDPNVIYVKLLGTTKEQYSKYIAID